MTEFPWPKAGQLLFTDAAEDWEHNAWLPADPDWVAYVAGYERALKILVEHVVDTDRDQDFLVYPIVFVARHAVELRLKDVILLARRLLRRESETFPATHDLGRLWTLARALLEDLNMPPATEDLEALGEYVDQLADVDRQSFTFRYPVERDGTTPAYVTEGRQRVHKILNVRHFGEALGQLLAFLSGCSEQLAVFLDHRDEMNS